jgi:hypothetical protein
LLPYSTVIVPFSQNACLIAAGNQNSTVKTKKVSKPLRHRFDF